jgi:hypothetical protein
MEENFLRAGCKKNLKLKVKVLLSLEGFLKDYYSQEIRSSANSDPTGLLVLDQ